MANVSRINGFRPVKHVLGAHIQAKKYFIPSTDGTAVYLGDIVKLAGSADTDGTCPTVAIAAAGDAVLGVVVGFLPNPSNLNVDGQYRVASTDRYVYVIDDPYVVFEAQTSNGTLAAADIGLNANHAVGSPSTTTAQSGATVDVGSKNTTATLTLKIMGFRSRVDNEVAASAKVEVMINNHQLRGTGVLGV